MNLKLLCEWHPAGKSPVDPLPYGLIGYINSNFAGDPKHWKLVIGYCFFIHGAVILWSSKK